MTDKQVLSQFWGSVLDCVSRNRLETLDALDVMLYNYLLSYSRKFRIQGMGDVLLFSVLTLSFHIFQEITLGNCFKYNTKSVL